MPEENSVMEVLTRELGTSATDVKPQAASSPALDASPQPQVGNAAQVPQTPPSAVPETMGRGRTPEEVIAMKERALADKDMQLQAAVKRANEQEAISARMLDQFSAYEAARAAAPVATEPKEAPQPDNWGEMSGQEQAGWIAEQKARTIVMAALAEERAAQQRHLAPILARHNETVESIERERVLQRYPNFPLAQYEQEVNQMRAGAPALRLHEAVELVASRHDPAMLLPSTRQAPVSLPAVPSASTAAAGPGQQITPQPTGPTMDQLIQAAGQANIAGSTPGGKRLVMEILRQKGMLDQHGQHVPIPTR